ncbi:MAG: HAMP domain-containing sensor histidine kinase [Desulfosarcinaceae bacterium]|nr:HAMP domain-containing sensor histidine kinase [Desulfosarcinaceae bacterium]
MKSEQRIGEPVAPIGQMLSVYRHHLGNSVNAIQITLQVLMENLSHWEEAKIRTYLERLDLIANEQGKLLQALKAYALDCGPREPLLTDQVWRQLTDMAAEMRQEHSVTLQLGASPPAARVRGNLLALEMIWRHLIENAVEAMRWVEAPQLTLRAASDGGFIVFEISDNGIGIDAAHLATAQLPLFTTKKGKNGMGLAVVSKLVRELTGQFEMDSVADQGTQVRVRLYVESGHSSGESF